jgi:hypothetical protein
MNAPQSLHPISSAVEHALDRGVEWPQTIRPEHLEGLFTELAAAVPATIAYDPDMQRRDRYVHVAVMRIVLAARQYKPDTEWGRQTVFDVELERIINTRLKTQGKEGKARFQRNTPLETKIARCIYPDPRRANVCSTVVRAALEKGITPDELVTFIEESGGTEAIRRNKAKPAEVDPVKLMWATKPLATIDLAQELIGEQTSDLPKVLLCTVRKTGEVDVRWVVDSVATARSGLAAMVKEVMDSQSIVTPDTSRA